MVSVMPQDKAPEGFRVRSTPFFNRGVGPYPPFTLLSTILPSHD